MNSLIITNSHILYGEWSSVKDKSILNDLKYIALSKPIKEVLKSQNSVRTILKEAIDKFSTKGNQVAIVIDDGLLYHDKFASEESLTKREIWDYIQWETKQKWGELGNYYTSFAEIDSPNPNALHSIACPAFLLTEVKALITNQGGKAIWAGPLSTIYLENNKYRNAIYMTDDDAFIKFFYRGRDGYSEGKLRFIAGQPSVSVIIGDKEEQNSLFKVPNDARDFVSIDLISDIKNTYLRQFRHKRMFPFDGIDVKIDDIQEDISFISLNALSIMMRDFSFESLVNFFNPAQIQNRKYEGIGKLSFDQEGERIKTKEETIEKEQVKIDRTNTKKAEKEQVKKAKADKKQIKRDSIDKKKAEKEQAKIDRANTKKAEKEQAEKARADKKQAKQDNIDKKKAKKEQATINREDKKKAPKEKDVKDKNKYKEVNIFPFLLIILLGALSYYLFFTGNGKSLQSDLKEKISLTKSNDKSDGLLYFDQQFNQSSSLINNYSLLTSIVSPDSIISVNIVDTFGSIEFVGKDSLDIPNFNITLYSLDTIECCGGVQHKVEYEINPLPDIRSNIWLSVKEITEQIQSSLGISKIRQLDTISENGTKYSPIIFETNSLSQIDNTIQYLKFVGDNIIVRKIDITNTPPDNNYAGQFYIAVFEPL
jgi:hypothetical protein